MAANEPKKDDKRAAKEAAEALMRTRRKRVLSLTGSVTAVLAGAFVCALLAVPKGLPRVIAGPFVGALTAQKVQVNLSDGRSFLVLDLNVLYDAPSTSYFVARTLDEVCGAQVRDALVAVASSKSRADVADVAQKPVFLEELRRAVEPLLFPVHIGETRTPEVADRESGLRPGASNTGSTLRDPFGRHVLAVDALARTLSIDDGPVTHFSATDDDLAVAAADGSCVYVDVTQLERDFRGRVPIGVHGRVRRILLDEMLIQ